MYLIEDIKKVEPFHLFLQFNDGIVRKISLEEELNNWSKTKGSIYKQLLNPAYFSTVKLNKELKTIYWENGVDFCPDMLYQWSEKT